MYLIRKNGTNKFVAHAGMKNSYTHNMLAAKRFPTLKMAQANCCGNETPVLETGKLTAELKRG